MTPTLAQRGRLVLLLGALFVTAGSIWDSWSVIALGTLVVSTLACSYLWFFQLAILLRRRKVEMAWWVPPGDQPGGALTVEHPFDLHLTIRNHGPTTLRVDAVDIYASPAIISAAPARVHVPPSFEIENQIEMRARAAGHFALHGALLCFRDAVGFFDLCAYFPNPLRVKVFPTLATARAERVLARPHIGALHEKTGRHTLTRRGLAGDLREIRDHALGDPFKFIAWKATARRHKLMVREFDNEIVLTHQLLVDVAGSMRGGSPGRTKLDYAIATAAALARATLDAGDRVGLITFDTRVYDYVKPGEGHAHLLRMVDHLLETRNAVDEAVTDVTDGELTATVARYLAYQEGIDVRVTHAPQLDDPAWEKLATGPNGDLYNMEALLRVLDELIRVHRDAPRRERSAFAPPASWWQRSYVGPDTPADLDRLRLFCRLRGIELPYLTEHNAGERAAGLAAALGQATARSRSQLIIVVSDLGGLWTEAQAAQRAIALARRRHHHLIVIAPFAPAFAPPPLSGSAQRVAEILALDEQRLFARAARLLQQQGVPVLRVGPEDTLSVLSRRMARTRIQVRRCG